MENGCCGMPDPAGHGCGAGSGDGVSGALEGAVALARSAFLEAGERPPSVVLRDIGDERRSFPAGAVVLSAGDLGDRRRIRTEVRRVLGRALYDRRRALRKVPEYGSPSWAVGFGAAFALFLVSFPVLARFIPPFPDALAVSAACYAAAGAAYFRAAWLADRDCGMEAASLLGRVSGLSDPPEADAGDRAAAA